MAGYWLRGGGGKILRFLQSIDIRGVGIESDKNECDFAASKGLEVYNHFIDVDNCSPEVDELIGQSDVVSCINVIEHIADPVSFVRYLYDRMKPGAVFVFEVPRHPSMASFANQTCDHAVYRHMVSPIHLQIFSEKSLDVLLGGQNGLSIVGKWEFGQGYTDLLNNALLMSGKRESPLYVELMNLSNQLQPIIDEAGYADQMLIAAQKAIK